MFIEKPLNLMILTAALQGTPLAQWPSAMELTTQKEATEMRAKEQLTCSKEAVIKKFKAAPKSTKSDAAPVGAKKRPRPPSPPPPYDRSSISVDGSSEARPPTPCPFPALPGGDGDGLRMYSDVLVPADECTFDEVREAALRDELRDHRGPTCAPSSAPKEHFAPHALAERSSSGRSSPCKVHRAQAPRRPAAGPYPERGSGPENRAVGRPRRVAGGARGRDRAGLHRVRQHQGGARQEVARAQREARPRQGPRAPSFSWGSSSRSPS